VIDRSTTKPWVGGRCLPGAQVHVRCSRSAVHVSYVSSGAPVGLDFKRKEVFGRVELSGARTEIDLEAGYADISGQSVDEGGALLRAHLSRRLTPSVTGFINAVREYPTSEESALSVDPAVAEGSDYGTSDFTSGPRLATSFGAGLRFTRPRTESSISYTYREEESLLAGAGQRKYGELRGQLTRSFTPAVRGTLYAGMTDEDFAGVAGNAQERSIGAEVGISFGRALGLDLRIEHNNRDGFTTAGDYSELSGGIFLRYSGQL
jgi:hypothetical protein